MQSIFLAAKSKLANDIPSETIQPRLHSVEYTLFTPLRKGGRFDSYGSSRVPAYYDPNTHTVFLNHKRMTTLDKTTAFTICYHELVHSISHHSHTKTPEGTFFQSGIKVERFRNGTYRCFHRMLNEGIVQFLTTYFNNLDSDKYAYCDEVRIAQHLSEVFGVPTIKYVLLTGDYRKLEQLIDDRWGKRTFSRLSRALDQKKYTVAEQLIAA